MNIFQTKAADIAKKSGNILNGFQKAIKSYETLNTKISLLEEKHKNLQQKHKKEIDALESEIESLHAILTSNERQKSKIESFLE